MNKSEAVKQTKLAFEFIEKLYLEISYLIKEIEGLLAQEDEKFVIGRPAGYAITSKSSSGLETNQVSLWVLRKMSVFFVPDEQKTSSGGVTNSAFTKELKAIYLRVVIDERDIQEPYLLCGVFHDFSSVTPNGLTKCEQLMAHIEYRETKVFSNKNTIDYEDGKIKFKGELLRVDLFDLNSSEDIVEKIIKPVLKMYREIKI